jgi:hypothetical protein
MGPMERADFYNRMIADFTLQVQPTASSDRPDRGDVQAERAEPSASHPPAPPRLAH